jgi:uncharacterized protein YeaO (DUF488 family)
MRKECTRVERHNIATREAFLKVESPHLRERRLISRARFAFARVAIHVVEAVMIKTKRWNDPREPDDGYRLLVCRYRPRGISRERETWDAWLPHLGPSAELHAAVYGKHGPPISWDEYAARYIAEVELHRFWIRGFAEKHERGETLTLLCSSACVDPEHCHRTLLKKLIENALHPEPTVSRRVIRRRSSSTE